MGAFSTTPRQDFVSVLFSLWITVGGFVDGFAHRNLDTPETFFTPWHAILYTGYLTSAAWIISLVIRNRSSASSLGNAIPIGYETAVAGVVVFAIGGLGDMFWHMAFGTEVSVDALLSPTHLMLLVGALLILSGPVRSARNRPVPARLLVRGFIPPFLGVTMAASQVGFFFQYIEGFSNRFMETVYVPGSEEGFFQVTAGIASMLITTVIVMGAVLLLIRDWPIPVGSLFALFAVYGLLMEFLEGYEFPQEVITPLVGGVAAEVLYRVVRPDHEHLLRMRAFAFLVPVVLWSVHMVVISQTIEINWPVAVWSGIIVMSGLASVGLSLLAFPSRAMVPS